MIFFLRNTGFERKNAEFVRESRSSAAHPTFDSNRPAGRPWRQGAGAAAGAGYSTDLSDSAIGTRSSRICMNRFASTAKTTVIPKEIR